MKTIKPSLSLKNLHLCCSLLTVYIHKFKLAYGCCDQVTMCKNILLRHPILWKRSYAWDTCGSLGRWPWLQVLTANRYTSELLQFQKANICVDWGSQGSVLNMLFKSYS